MGMRPGTGLGGSDPGEAGLDRGCVTPVITVAAAGAAAVVGDRDAGLAGGCGQGADPALGQVEGSFVFGSDGGVEEVRVAQAHLGGHVTEQGHEGLERHAGVDQRRGVCVAELVWSDVVDPGGLSAAGELFANRSLGQAPAVVGEQKLGRSPGAGVGQRFADRAGCADPVDERHGFVVEGDHAFGVELA